MEIMKQFEPFYCSLITFTTWTAEEIYNVNISSALISFEVEEEAL